MSLAVCGAILLAQSPAQAEFAEAWRHIEAEIRVNYFQRDTRQEEMERRLAAYGPRARTARTRSEFAGIVGAMIAEFQDSHFYFFTKSDQLFYGLDGARNAGWDGVPVDRMRYPSIGAWFWPASNGWEVWMLEPGGALAKQGIQRKDIFLECDGKPFEPVESLRGRVGQTSEFTIRRGGTTLRKRLKIEAAEFWRDLNAAATSQVLQLGGRRFAYVWFSHMYGDKGQFDYFYRRSSAYDGIILDLRDGLGGFFEPHLGPFMTSPSTVSWTFPGGGSSSNQIGFGGLPMVVLTNRRTISAREFMAYYLRKHRGARIVGEPTAGGVVGGYVTKTYGWWNMMIPYSLYAIDGVVFERNPLKPDVEVADEMGEQGLDAILERGCQELLHMIGPGQTE